MPLSWMKKNADGRLMIENEPGSVFALAHLIRITEEALLDLFSKGLLNGTVHTCIGQEICALSVVRALNKTDDIVLSNHRNHGHFLAYGGEVEGLVGEIMGKQAGVCQGHGGSQHIAYKNFHSNGIQGGLTGIGVGMAMALKTKKSDGIVGVFLGDGTTGEGILYESLNLAAVFNAPVLFVIEDNKIAQTTLTQCTIAGKIEDRGRAFGLRTLSLSDTDEAFLEKVEGFVSQTRLDRKPGFLVIETSRLGPHSKGDDSRTDEEKKLTCRGDLLHNYRQRLDGQRAQALENENKEYLRQCIQRAQEDQPSSFDADDTKNFFEQGFSNEYVFETKGRTVLQRLNSAFDELLTKVPEVLLIGEDLHDPYGGAFKVTKGLSTKFKNRVISTPISEAGIIGMGTGLAMAGFRPVVEVMFADFLSLGLDQIYNHAAKFPSLFPDIKVPLVVRTPAGGGRGYGPTHSQSPENIFVSVPGLTVVFGSHRHQVDQLLIQAVLSSASPVLFLEHKLLYACECSSQGYEILPAAEGSLGKLFPTLIKKCTTPDLTILAYGGSVLLAEDVAAHLQAEEDLLVEIIVPSLLSPIPLEMIDRLVKSENVLIIEESHKTFGVGAEILAMMMEGGFKGRASRSGALSVPIPSAKSLEKMVLPQRETVIEEIYQMFA